MKRIIVSLAAALALATVALAGSTTPTGVRFSMLGGGTDRAFQANTAFYVYHGFRTVAGDSSPQEIQQSSITLTADGVSQKGFIVQEFSDTKPRALTGKFYLFNFPTGLPVGHHTLTIEFIFKGEVQLARTYSIDSVDPCQYGTFDGLQCQGPPA
jgi:hypothetical protein